MVNQNTKPETKLTLKLPAKLLNKTKQNLIYTIPTTFTNIIIQRHRLSIKTKQHDINHQRESIIMIIAIVFRLTTDAVKIQVLSMGTVNMIKMKGLKLMAIKTNFQELLRNICQLTIIWIRVHFKSKIQIRMVKLLIKL